MSVFGVGTDLSESAWRGVLRHLIALGIVEVDHSAFGTLALTQASGAVLKGERQLTLRRQTLSDSRSRVRAPRASTAPGFSAEAGELFDRLRAWRAATARAHGVPAYVIFHDATLRDIALRQPGSTELLADISGVGTRKLQAYGEAILAIVAGASAPPAD